MKRLVEDFVGMMKIGDEVSVEDTKSPLEKELIRVYEYLKDKGETDIKEYETAYQEAIEKIYPENLWWEVIDLNIFWDLFENKNPRATIDTIIASVKPEFKEEVIDTVVTEDVEEENPLKDIRSNIMEFPNGEYVYVEYVDGKLYAGSATNTGIIHEYEMDYDKDFDVDKNLQDFFDKIIEENPELGEPLDESKQRKRRNRRVTEAKQERISKSAKQYIKVFQQLFNGLTHWNNNFSAYASADEYANKKNIQKLFKKVDSMISDVATFAIRFKTVYNSLLAAGISTDKSPSTIKRLLSNLSQKYMKMSDEWRDDKSDRAKNGNLADIYYAYASSFEDLSDYVDEVSAEYSKDIKESLSRKQRVRRIYESMKRKQRVRRIYESMKREQRVRRIYESMKRKPKKNLKEAADDEIKLFMNTWANYNEHGADGVITPTGWMSLDEAEEYADEYEEYEPFINDTDNVPKELDVDEYSDISETVDMLRRYEEFDDTQREVLVSLIDDGYDVNTAVDKVDDGDYYYIAADNDTELAENYIDELGGVEELDRDTLARYFDYEAFGRDLSYDFRQTDNGYVKID